jgi:broad-specificity NMP kinase
MDQDRITVVSGLPRSGTSMVMAMLKAGGLSLLTDEARTADEDNPKGYFEFERVKRLKEGDAVWLDSAVGQVVKVISYLLPELPQGFHYDVVFVKRRLSEILASQRRMLERAGEDPDKVDQDELAEILKRHLEQVQEWLENQSNVRVVYIDYNKMLTSPDEEIRALVSFFDRTLDSRAMKAVIDHDLYRQRDGS